MRPSCHLIKRFNPPIYRRAHRRNLLTLAIETSCDDTSVAVLERHENNYAVLHFHEKITSDNQSYGGVHPIVAHESHQKNLAILINKALGKLPSHQPQIRPNVEQLRHGLYFLQEPGKEVVCRKKPDFITVTRGPGMRANLITGLDTAKGLAVAWQIPLLGVNHMQAHALTPRLVCATQRNAGSNSISPSFPFLTLLVSGGHTMLVHSKSLCDHEILANTTDIAVGDMIDKCARDILPRDVLKETKSVMYGPMLEKFAFPDGEIQYNYRRSSSKRDSESMNWSITLPLQNYAPSKARAIQAMFSFSGIGSSVKRFMKNNPAMDNTERQLLARETMRIGFEHLSSRVVLALETQAISNIKTLVVSGGVASNHYLKQVVRKSLDANGHQEMELVFPPPKFCTDNAAMIAWTGMEMWDEGYRTALNVMPLRKWAIDPNAEDGGILGVDGWQKGVF